jgi:hypothetical protein
LEAGAAAARTLELNDMLRTSSPDCRKLMANGGTPQWKIASSVLRFVVSMAFNTLICNTLHEADINHASEPRETRFGARGSIYHFAFTIPPGNSFHRLLTIIRNYD